MVGPTPPGHGRDRRGDGLHRREVHVAGERAVGEAVDAHVDHGGAGLHVRGPDQARAAHRHHQHVRLTRHRGQVRRLAVGHRHGGVLREEELGHGLAHDARPPDHRGQAAAQGNAVVLEDGHDPRRRARARPRG